MAFNKAKAVQEAEKLAAQGKVSQAIKEYLKIIEKDSTSVDLLNTVGDLYVRDKNIPEALGQFNKLAEAFTRAGFTLKAIAIYKKISKLETNNAEPLLKLGELYTVQGLGREAREQYAQALDFYRKKNQVDKVLDIFRRVIQLDPENPAHRARMAAYCEEVGRKSDAAQAYVEAAQSALRRGEHAAVEQALKKALDLDPKNPQAVLLKARVALATQSPGDVEKILRALPDFKDRPEARALLLEAYLATQNQEAAEKILLEVYRADPGDFSPLASFAAICVEKGEYDAALKPLSAVADDLLERKEAEPLKEVLKQIWAKAPTHIPSLELLQRVSERTADEATLPEVLQALGHAYVQAGELAKAEAAFQALVKREPENEQYRGMLKQVLKKEGKEQVALPAEALESVEMALEPEVEVTPAATPSAGPAAAVDDEQATAVKEALDNSDLCVRYGLAEKAIEELEKVLAVYPDQVDLHKRILELCARPKPARATQAAQALAKIYGQRGDQANSRKYDAIARGAAPVEEVEAPTPPPPAPRQPGVQDFDLSMEAPLAAPTGAEVAPQPPTVQEFPLGEFAPPAAEAEPTPAPIAGLGEQVSPATPAAEFDLTAEFGTAGAPAEAEAQPPAAPTAPAFNYEEVKVEVDFYLGQDLESEAEKVVEELEGQFPGDAHVADLREHFEASRRAAAAPAPSAVPEPVVEPPGAAPPSVPAPVVSPAIPEPVVEEPVAAGGADMLSGLADDLAASLEGIEGPAPRPAGGPAGALPPPTRPAEAAANPLSGLLDELSEPGEAQAAQDDPQTHYNLGVAFREMGLLDEAIGEFQKVVKGAQKGSTPANFLQACTLLAASFMEKNMPAIAAKWYTRALEAPNLDEEAVLALHYDLGVAYEQAGDTRTALEKFTEVYTLNIDYRDVAEKIRVLQQKVS